MSKHPKPHFLPLDRIPLVSEYGLVRLINLSNLSLGPSTPVSSTLVFGTPDPSRFIHPTPLRKLLDLSFENAFSLKDPVIPFAVASLGCLMEMINSATFFPKSGSYAPISPSLSRTRSRSAKAVVDRFKDDRSARPKDQRDQGPVLEYELVWLVETLNETFIDGPNTVIRKIINRCQEEEDETEACEAFDVALQVLSEKLPIVDRYDGSIPPNLLSSPSSLSLQELQNACVSLLLPIEGTKEGMSIYHAIKRVVTI